MSHWLMAAALCGTVAAMLLMAAGWVDGMARSSLLVVATALVSTAGVVLVGRLVMRGVARDRSRQVGEVQDLAERVDALEQRMDGVGGSEVSLGVDRLNGDSGGINAEVIALARTISRRIEAAGND